MLLPKPSKRPNLIEQYTSRMNNMQAPKTASFSVGNRVYNGGMPSPHAGGGLDPQGYQEREQRAKASALQNFLRKGK